MEVFMAIRELPQQEVLSIIQSPVDDQIQHGTSASSLLLWTDQTDKEEKNTVNNIGVTEIIHSYSFASLRYW
jgi:hypothetical protein